MTMTEARATTKILLSKRASEALAHKAGIHNPTDVQTICDTISAITKAAKQEKAAFPDVALSRLVAVVDNPDHRVWDGEPQVTDLPSVVVVMESPLLIAAVRRRKPHSMSPSAIAIMEHFVSAVA